jgi:hypothetical protein
METRHMRQSAGHLQDAVDRGGAVPYIATYDVQSYLSPVRGAAAILVPGTPKNKSSSPVVSRATSVALGGPSANGIVSSTQDIQQIRGVGFALLPASQAPVAILPTFEKGPSHGSAIFLKPGQIFYPGHDFKEFKIGLPYGWLGGGTVYLLVLREHMGYAFWTGDKEVIFHRVTLPVLEAGANITTALVPNWPNRFPWTNAVAYDSVSGKRFPLPGQPQFGVTPTRVVARYLLPAAATIPSGGIQTTFDFINTDDFDTGSVGEANIASALPVYWPGFTQSGLDLAGTGILECPIQTLNSDQIRIGGDSCSLVIISPDSSAPAGSFIDLVRYGTL